jgi:hypothetical protein
VDVEEGCSGPAIWAEPNRTDPPNRIKKLNLALIIGYLLTPSFYFRPCDI